jgi:glycosyltransferase involved in cell wall biosynthesis
MRSSLLQVYYTFGTGGVERIVHNLSDAMREHGHYSHLMIVGHELGNVDRGRFDSVELIPPSGLRVFRCLTVTKRIIEQKIAMEARIGVRCKVLIHSPGIWARLLPRDGCELVIHSIESRRLARETVRTRSRRLLMKWALSRHRLVAVSAGVKADLTDAFSVRPDHIRVIRNKVNVSTLLEYASEPAAAPAARYILHVGRFEEVKQQHHLLEAAKSLPPDVSVVFMGTGNVQIQEELAANAKRAGLLSRVLFIGHKSNPYPIIRSATCLVLCSRTEAMPMVLIEALVLGVPVVSYDCPTGPREILESIDPDSLVPANDIQRLAARLTAVCQQTPKVDVDYYRAAYNLSTSCEEYLA